MAPRSQKQRWERNYAALVSFVERNQHAVVPGAHVEQVGSDWVAIGPWVAYLRQRHRKGLLSVSRQNALTRLPGWSWGPQKEN